MKRFNKTNMSKQYTAKELRDGLAPEGVYTVTSTSGILYHNARGVVIKHSSDNSIACLYITAERISPISAKNNAVFTLTDEKFAVDFC